jgi:hypothetical protein
VQLQTQPPPAVGVPVPVKSAQVQKPTIGVQLLKMDAETQVSQPV